MHFCSVIRSCLRLWFILECVGGINYAICSFSNRKQKKIQQLVMQLFIYLLFYSTSAEGTPDPTGRDACPSSVFQRQQQDQAKHKQHL